MNSTIDILDQVNANLPTIILLSFALLMLLIDLFLPKRNHLFRSLLAIGSLCIVYLVVKLLLQEKTVYTYFFSLDSFSYFFHILFITVLVFTFLLSGPYFERTKIKFPETSLLLFFSTAGAMIMISANDLIVMFLGLELMSICLYVLAGMLRKRVQSNEGALKYFLLGAFSSGFLLYGITLFYGITGSTNYSEVNQWISQTSNKLSLTFWIGAGLILIGFFFKFASVPFHFWSPDAYEGAPTPITAFFSATPKAAAFGTFIKILIVAFPLVVSDFELILKIIAIATMGIGNFVALQQKSVKRMLAYSSISHAGYLMVALVVKSNLGYSSILLYLIVYSVTNLGAFTIAYLVNRKNEGSYSYEDYNGLATKYPVLAMFMALFMISLAGIPPTGGFFVKYYIFYSALKADQLLLAILMALFSAISVYYYLKVIVHMYMKPLPDSYETIKSDTHVTMGLIFSSLIIIIIGVAPSFWLTLTNRSVSNILINP
ncbi:MAG: NADH-quinone oxidoreductase subunit N [bacterium]|nr:NADH-quinone oxidoreductase subunit N [bacterium]